MNQLIICTTETDSGSIEKPLDTNRVYYSALREGFSSESFRSFSIKYVISGSIAYKAGKKEFKVGDNRYLIANRKEGVLCRFHAPVPVKSICVDISEKTMAEAMTVLSAKENFQFDNYLDQQYKLPVFAEKITALKSGPVSEKLMRLAESVQTSGNHYLDETWFYEMAEAIILQEKGKQLALHGLHSVKSTTRLETLRRLNKAKAYMDELFLQHLPIPQISAHCNMSEFHFFRCFKQAFGITPYQYLLLKRLDHSRQLLLQTLPEKEIAVRCGFADVFTYSKAFKRTYGIPPSAYKRRQLLEASGRLII